MGTDAPSRKTVSTAPPAEAGRSVSKAHLVNRLNYLNFQDQTILVSLRHQVYDDAVFLHARPQPCGGDSLELAWAEPAGLSQLLKTYRFEFLLIADGRKYLVVNAEMVTMDDGGINIVLPAACREFQARKIKRHPARETVVQLLQHGVMVECELVDFSPVSLRVAARGCSALQLQLINTEAPVHLRLVTAGETVYSGAFAVHSRRLNGRSCTFVLLQLKDNINRFKRKRYRNRRLKFHPSPSVVFDHPLIEKRVNLKIADLSGTGFSVEENEGDSVLMPGMMLPRVRIGFAEGLSLDCRAQVVFRRVTDEAGGEATARCGFAILDMEIRDHARLLSLLHQAADRNSQVSTEVDLDELWDFFFETGFIYPGKYLQFQANKEEIKETYTRLYTGNPQIARHFIYLDRGAILGHLAMVRFYRDAWLIHHHAALKSSLKAGLAVLEQVSHYLNELESFSFAHLRYVYCYYRPDNRFPSRIFGGFAREHGDQSSCSLDSFGYTRFTTGGAEEAVPAPWEFEASTPFDLSEVVRHYRHVSGGVLTRAFDLEGGGEQEDELAQKYRELGFRKEKYRYSLRKGGSLKAFFLVNVTDAGFNMAELTNCVTLIVLDEEVPAQVMRLCLERVSRHYEGGSMALLTLPDAYPGRLGLPLEKNYLLWVLDMHYSDDYFRFCERLFRSAGKSN